MLRQALVALMLTTVVALAAPADAAPPADRNVAFLLALAGFEAMPDGVATVTDASGTRELPIADAFSLAAGRAGGVDVAALAASAAESPISVVLGDFWTLEMGSGSCPEPTHVGVGGPAVETNPQSKIYGGSAGVVSTEGSGLVYDWTTKSVTSYTGGVTIVGQSDFFCISFFGFYIFFPFSNGILVFH